ncbi:MAG: hypothetical protein M1827_005118 [Pycnora praestabilis]|nr:MAG: hypothetical protein M1827_005118 [Pycnora praestabilis]
MNTLLEVSQPLRFVPSGKRFVEEVEDEIRHLKKGIMEHQDILDWKKGKGWGLDVGGAHGGNREEGDGDKALLMSGGKGESDPHDGAVSGAGEPELPQSGIEGDEETNEVVDGGNQWHNLGAIERGQEEHILHTRPIDTEREREEFEDGYVYSPQRKHKQPQPPSPGKALGRRQAPPPRQETPRFTMKKGLRAYVEELVAQEVQRRVSEEMNNEDSVHISPGSQEEGAGKAKQRMMTPNEAAAAAAASREGATQEEEGMPSRSEARNERGTTSSAQAKKGKKAGGLMRWLSGGRKKDQPRVPHPAEGIGRARSSVPRAGNDGHPGSHRTDVSQIDPSVDAAAAAAAAAEQDRSHHSPEHQQPEDPQRDDPPAPTAVSSHSNTPSDSDSSSSPPHHSPAVSTIADVHEPAPSRHAGNGS